MMDFAAMLDYWRVIPYQFHFHPRLKTMVDVGSKSTYWEHGRVSRDDRNIVH